MKKCNKCGKLFPDTFRFCVSCGEQLFDNNTESSPYKFEMRISDVFYIPERGPIVTGVISSGILNMADRAIVLHSGGSKTQVVVIGVTCGRQLIDEAGVGTDVGVLLRDIDYSELRIGDILVGEK